MPKRSHTLLLFTLTLVLVSIPTFLFAQEIKYHPLVGVPGVPDDPTDIEQYINALYVLSIGLASMLAVVKIIMAGVQYMLTDVVTAKGEAKKDIMGALLGLVLILGAVTILNTINPNLTTFNIFDDSRQLTVPVEGDDSQNLGTPTRSKRITDTTSQQEINRFISGCEGRGETVREHKTEGQKQLVCYAPHTNTSSDGANDRIRREYPNVGAVYNQGNYGSQEHLEFLNDCREKGRVPVTSQDGSTVECRY